MATLAPVRWRSDFDKFVVVSNFERRGWIRWVPAEGDDWNFFWASVGTVKQIFNPDNGIRLGEHQMINHFPNHYELTRKDLMVKNLKRYKKEVEKETLLGGEGHSLEWLEFLPLTFSLPADYALFAEEFKRHSHSTWIMKPTSKSQGKGIFLVNKISTVKRWMGVQTPNVRGTLEPYVISRYIENPLLIGGRKFDLRLYVCVTAYRPLKAYFSNKGFARFCNSKYTAEIAELDNLEVHLTNVAINKHGKTYNERHGNKWPLANLKLYMEGTHGHKAADQLFQSINAIIIHSLKAVQGVMVNDRHCFELYGYDIIIDDTLKPWIIEVNASPSLSSTTESDRSLKCKVIHDVMNLVVPEDFPECRAWANKDPDQPRYTPQTVGSFELLVDEESEMANKRENRMAAMRLSGKKGF
mmetsp:Transcript_5923/g.10258  ORF Transcript_5923/g.10258 Transcript_5923/m.10258 type:complete len:412 (-) Transcript_5923:188-1423(-)